MTYDYIVVGGGSSGSLLAARLAYAGAKILVLEAGGSDKNPLISMPAGFVKLLGTEKFMWFYQSTVQQRLHGRQPVVPTGKVVGGGSSVNAMVYIRGQAGDYTPWVEATDDEGWGWDALLPIFKEMEDNNRLQDELHSIGGPWKVSDPVQICDLSRSYVLAAQAAGIPFNNDFNGPRQTGAGYFQLSVENGRRCSASSAFLRPAMKATGNIDLLTGCLVHKIVIENGRATGVQYSRKGVTETVKANSEIALCAGAIATPKIMMLSGIGPHFHLKEHGIETLVDHEGVGQNLQDHTEVPVLAFTKPGHGYFGQDKGFNQIRNGLQYMMFKSGPVASNGVEAGSFFHPDDLSQEATIQQFCVPSVYLDPDTTDLKPTYGLTINSCVLRPGSRGSVRLANNNANTQPLVDPNYFEDPEDLRLSVGGLKIARKILDQEPLREIITKEVFPGPDLQDDAALEDHAKKFVKTVYHPVGTVRMGREDDSRAVLTADLKVKGIEGLRVADASAMPTIISGNTNSTTLVVAERAARFMLNE
ncbi:GMC family oxidoreductase [Lentibacter sp. XHP0401]|uniref:GMC family oxidoreductase n=1 Tax=Lentibacter sp. XHP0401 TaxID=2984334 RepID=UPI0021E8EDC1|nr:GMC family oxidoreductase N-terminal domain-containing protein [Lentibacter sp. XHP0401]MCV2894661.1 GMC family oxidoreductase N-terminal domain-containing protein [Lentibacter sp. XHP0401]